VSLSPGEVVPTRPASIQQDGATDPPIVRAADSAHFGHIPRSYAGHAI